jgi:hypothetical protein
MEGARYRASAMGEMDVSLRRLVRRMPRPLLQLAFPDRPLEPLGPFDPSVDRARQRTADNLFRVRDSEGEVAVHVEIERGWRPPIARRLFDYATAAFVATGLPVWSVLVLLRPGGRPPEETGEYRIRGPGHDAFVFRYSVVPLWQLDARSMLAQLGVRGAPFCVAMRGADEAMVRGVVEEMHGGGQLTEGEQQTTMQLLYVMTAAILGIETARRIFHMEWLLEDPNVQELIREWEDKGLAKGRNKVLAEGHAEEARKLLYKVLAVRSFAVTDDLRARIDAEADVARLEAWLEATVNARSIGDVFRDD